MGCLSVVFAIQGCGPVLSEVSDLCEISDLSLFVSYFASQSEGMKFGDYSFDVR